MTRLMVLGGGRHQVPLVERAEARGIQVVLVDYLDDAPGRTVASFVESSDATDAESAVSLAKHHGVQGVTTTGTDIPVRTMAAVAQAMDLPCYLSVDAAYKATDKETMYEALTALDVPMARRLVLEIDEGFDPDRLPVVIKPADSQGQRGITVVRDRETLTTAIDHARTASRSGRAIIEEFLVGPEFTANVWIRDGAVSLLLVNDRITFNPSPYLGIAFQHRHPSQAAAESLDEVRSIVERVAKAYGMREGPLYIQMIETDHGPVVVEAAARIGGGHESRLLLALNQWSTDDALIDLALGHETSPPPPVPETADALVNFVLGSAGTVGKFDSMRPGDGIAEGSWYVSPGAVLTDVVNSLGRVGYFIARADDPRQLMERAARFYRDLTLPSEDGRNLVHVPDEAILNSP